VPKMSIEMLVKERVVELWPQLMPLLDAACNGNPIAISEMDVGHIFITSQLDNCVVFVGMEDNVVTCVLVLQFNDTNGHKGADVMALAGRGLLRFKALYWQTIIDWLRGNGVEFLDAYTPIDRVKMYKQKFGFETSCAYVRMTL